MKCTKVEAKWLSVTECNGQGMNLNVEVRSPKNEWEEGGVGLGFHLLVLLKKERVCLILEKIQNFGTLI